MGGNNEFFENFERNKYLKKLPSMQRVKELSTTKLFCKINGRCVIDAVCVCVCVYVCVCVCVSFAREGSCMFCVALLT